MIDDEAMGAEPGGASTAAIEPGPAPEPWHDEAASPPPKRASRPDVAGAEERPWDEPPARLHGSTGLRKAAVFILSLEEEVASLVLRRLTDQELRHILDEIARLGVVKDDAVTDVVREYRELEHLHGAVREGGAEQAARLCERAFPGPRARRIVEILGAEYAPGPFSFLEDVQPDVLAACLEEEHPQTVAVILSRISHGKAAELLERLGGELRRDVLERIASLEGTPADVIESLDRSLRKQLQAVRFAPTAERGGVQAAANILRAAAGGGGGLLDEIRQRRPELAEEIAKRLFVFEDIVRLDDRALQVVLKEIESRSLALALKSAAEDVRRKVFANLPRRAGELLREEMEYLGPVRFVEVEAARRSIVETILRLEESGQLYISGRGREENRIVY